MRILYILTSLGVGGAEKQVIDLAVRMAANGHSVAFLVLKHADEEWPVKLPVMRLNIAKTPTGIVRGLRFAKKFLALFRADIVHSHTFPANIFARLLKGMVLTGGNAPKLVNTIHNVHEGAWHRMLIYGATDPLANEVTAVSGAAADRFLKLHAVRAKKMRVLTNGIDTEAFSPDRSRRKRVRTQMQAGKDFVWIAVGRLAPAKDYPNLLRAFEGVRSQYPPVRLWVVGEGDVEQWKAGRSGGRSGEHAGGHAGEHAGEGAAIGVEWLGLRRDVADLLDAADGYVLSSAWEGMPLALAEAMAMEKVVVATDVGGVRELAGEAGLIVPSKDSSALAKGMIQAMGMNDFERKAMGKQARERVISQFSMAAKAAEWQRFYAELVYDKSS